MKELSLYAIRDLALESGRAVFSVQQLANLIGKSRAISTVYSSRLVKKGLAKKTLKGKISFSDDDLVIATQLVEPSYISLGSALLFHEVIQQVQRNVECVTTKNSLKFNKLGVTYHKIPGSLFFGFKKHNKGNSFVLVAEPEKALIDGLYLNIYSEKHLKEFKNKLEFSKLQGFLKNFNGKGSKKLKRMISK